MLREDFSAKHGPLTAYLDARYHLVRALLAPRRSAARVFWPRRRPESGWRRLARVVSLQGFLLPSALLADRTLVQDKPFHGRASDVFRFRRVLYLHPATGEAYLAHFDRRRFFAELGAFLKAWVTVFARLRAVRKAYAEGAAAMTPIDFWRGVYAVEATRAADGDRGAPRAAAGAGQNPAPTTPGRRLENR